MIKSIGLDIVEISRIQADIEKYGDRFLDRILGAEELKIYLKRKDKAQFLSGRFAAKEAVIKALGRYITDKPTFPEIQILNDSTGQPELSLTETLSKIVLDKCFISITHEKSVAAAVAIFSEEK